MTVDRTPPLAVTRAESPLLLVHRSHQFSSRIPEALGRLMEQYGQLSLGTVARLPRMTGKTAQNFAESISKVPVRIYDPELWVHPSAGWQGADDPLKTTASKWPHMTEQPARPSAKWVGTALTVQKDLGATVLLSANGWISSTNAKANLSKNMKFVDESRALVGDFPMWVNFTLDYTWLTDRSLRNYLIEEIVESNEESWYLRFWWPEVPTRYGQLLDESILKGYAALARECELEDKKLYLPNSGLTGWLASAVGAAGFSTGTSWPEQAFARERIIARSPGSPPAPRIPRLFNEYLMHTMEYGEYERVRFIQGHGEEGSPYLDEIEHEGHSHESAGLHYLMAVGSLTEKLGSRRPDATAERLVRSAMKFVDSLTPVQRLNNISRPTHLKLWKAILSGGQ